MAIDIREISLTDEQKRRVAELAEKSGRSWRDVLNQQLSTLSQYDDSNGESDSPDRYIKDRNVRRAYFHEWASRRKSYNPNFDDSRESIYFGDV